MKKFIRGLIITLVVLIILPIALVFIFLFDTSKMAPNYDENFNKADWSKSLVVDSLDPAPTEKLLKFSVSEDDLNNYIHSAIKGNALINQYLTELAVDIQNDSYVLNVSGKYTFFETRARLTAKITKENVVDATGTPQPAFVLTVDKMTLGRLTKLKYVVNFILNKLIDNKTVDALTVSLKLHADLANSRFFIYTADLRDMINNAMTGGGGSGESQFYFAFINDFLDKNLINIDFYGGESLSVKVNLEPLTGNDYDAEAGNNVYYPMNYESTLTKLTINGEQKKLSLDVIREAIVALLDNGAITTANMQSVSDYLFQGFNGSNAPEADLSSIGITNKETYPGFGIVSAFSIDDAIKSDISTFASYSDSIDSFDIASITESDINNFLKTQGVFGNKFLMHRNLPENKNKVNYIALDNTYMNIYDKSAILSVGLNINGLETMVTLKMALDETNTSTKKLVYLPEKIYFGKESANLLLSSDSEKIIFDTLYQAIDQAAVTFDRNGKMTINFETLIDQAISSIDTSNPVLAQFKNFLRSDTTTIGVKVEGNAVTDNSTIKIQAVRH